MLTVVCRTIESNSIYYDQLFWGFMKKTILIKFGEKVREVRLKQGLSQEELASRAGVHRTYVGMIERGEKNITLENIDFTSLLWSTITICLSLDTTESISMTRSRLEASRSLRGSSHIKGLSLMPKIVSSVSKAAISAQIAKQRSSPPDKDPIDLSFP